MTKCIKALVQKKTGCFETIIGERFVCGAVISVKERKEL
jgi:hypothetical protein